MLGLELAVGNRNEIYLKSEPSCRYGSFGKGGGYPIQIMLDQNLYGADLPSFASQNGYAKKPLFVIPARCDLLDIFTLQFESCFL